MESASFEYTASHFIYQTAQWVDRLAPQESKFDKELTKKWNAAMDAGAFRYNVDNIDIRTIPGSKKYVALLNTLRGTERRKPQQMMSVKQLVNPNAFNFIKVNSSEIIFDLNHISDTPIGCGKDEENRSEKIRAEENRETHSMIINMSPVNKGHCLLVPDKYSCKPQVLTETAFKVALETILLSQNRGFALGFNSLLALASVNHLHWHVLYIPQQLYTHHCSVHHLTGHYYECTVTPVYGFALQLHGSTVGDISKEAHKITSYLYENDIPHNVFMCRGTVFGDQAACPSTTVRLFIWPRKKYLGDPTDEPFNLACIELAGFLAVRDSRAYEALKETDVDAQFKANSLDPLDYKKLREQIFVLGKSSDKENI